MYFCPLCESILVFQSSSNQNNFKCWNCPFFFPLQNIIKNEIKFHKKRKFNEIFTESNANLNKIQINCQKCDNIEAYYFQMQRSEELV